MCGSDDECQTYCYIYVYNICNIHVRSYIEREVKLPTFVTFLLTLFTFTLQDLLLFLKNKENNMYLHAFI